MRMAMFGSKPMRIGASTVAPNIAITCCTPIAAVCGQGRRSSGAITPPCCSTAAGFSVQWNRAICRSPSFMANRSMLGAMTGPCKARSGPASRSCKPDEFLQHVGVFQQPAVAEAVGGQQARAGDRTGERLAVGKAVDAVTAVVDHQRGRGDARPDGARLEL